LSFFSDNKKHGYLVYLTNMSLSEREIQNQVNAVL